MVLDNILQKLNNKYGTVDKKSLAIAMQKKYTDAQTAVINILSASGIAGFKFHIPETEMVKFENEITDHYIDTGTAIQDHIVQKPITITVTGLVGDYFYSNNKIEDFFALIIPTLTLVKEFIPEFTKTFGIKYGSEKELKNIQLPGGPQAPTLLAGISKNQFNVMDLFTLFQSLYKLKSAQTRAFLFFECLWKSRSLFSVETTWKRYDNMVVQSMQARRDNNADITEFSITFKQLSFAQTVTETFEQYVNRRQQEMSKTVNKGVEVGQQEDIERVFI